MQACIASIFEIPLEDAPSSNGVSGAWYVPIEHWAAARGYAVLWDEAYVPNAIGMKSVKSFRGDWLHSVVALGNDLIWDPSSDRDEGEREEPDEGARFTYFLKLDPFVKA